MAGQKEALILHEKSCQVPVQLPTCQGCVICLIFIFNARMIRLILKYAE